MEQLTLQKHEEPLPESKDAVLEYLKRVLSLSDVQKVTITKDSIEVERNVSEGSLVVPPHVSASLDEMGLDFLLQKIELTSHPFDPEEHPLWSLFLACATLAGKGLVATHVVAPTGDWLGAWIGLGECQPDSVWGMRVEYSDYEALEGRVVVLGSSNSSGYLSDVVHGVIVDMGVTP